MGTPGEPRKLRGSVRSPVCWTPTPMTCPAANSSEPKLLLLDEPTKGLDSFFKVKFASILERLKQQGITIVMVSHDVEFCAEYADLVSMFFDGQILTTDTPHRFFGQNSFYTTAANRMSRCVFQNAVTAGDVVTLYKQNMEG